MSRRFSLPPALHRLAAAGNAALAVLLVLLLLNAPRLFTQSSHAVPGATAPARPTEASARRALLVVVDGLRANAAADPAVMPRLNRLARRGGRGVAHVESLVPSSVAAVVTFTTGEVPAPASFLQNFGARPASDGCIFAAINKAGGKSFVAGPTLWTDLYGQWIDAAEASASFGGPDTRLTQAALAALRSGAYQLVVLHLLETDAAAHRYGAIAPEHATAARRADAAIDRVALSLPADVCLLVT